MTTKNASSSVIKSPYGIAQASWLECSSWRCFLRGRMASVQVALQLRLDGARVLALRDREHALDHHLAQLRLAVGDDPEFGGHRQEEQVGESDAVNRGGERGGDAVAELARIGQVLQHRH